MTSRVALIVILLVACCAPRMSGHHRLLSVDLQEPIVIPVEGWPTEEEMAEERARESERHEEIEEAANDPAFQEKLVEIEIDYEEKHPPLEIGGSIIGAVSTWLGR